MNGEPVIDKKKQQMDIFL